METFKKISKKLLFPHIAIVILLVPISAVLLVLAFLKFGSEHPFSYVAYVVSAYTLTVVCMYIPRLIKAIKRIKEENKYVMRLSADARLRVKLSLYGSLIMNTAYAFFQFGLGLYHGSFWFHSLALYYLLLVIMRFFLLRDVRGMTQGDNIRSELKRYRFCGVILLTMTLALVSMVFFITYFNRGVEHHYITTIALAAYTFASMTMAIVNVVKYRKYNSPLFSASKAINLAAATVSMLTLETAMLAAFGGEEVEQMRGLMTLLTGVGVCLFVVAIAISMICKATRELKKQMRI
ncbi:MAG: hypothetical protein J6A83_04870 [Clostridia bacterium]|nr:hypothetical protein [Clostridia bacterium]